MAYILRLMEHLLTRPIAPMLEHLGETEKNDEIALKFMCVVDYDVTRQNLYERISDTKFPKLFNELLGFHSYKSFQYYDYVGNNHFSNKFLQCKFAQCQFFGPYALVLTHMAINHNMHYGFKLCAYCCRVELKMHLVIDGSFQRCYEQYLQRTEISDIVFEVSAVCAIIADFYDVMKECAKKLGVYTKRQLHNYAGKGYGTAEQLTKRYGGDISRQTIVFYPKLNGKSMSIDRLKHEFNIVMTDFYGACGPSRFRNESKMQDGTLSESEDEANSNKLVRDEQQPSTSTNTITNTNTNTNTRTNGIRASVDTLSTHDRLDTASRASMTSAMSTQSNNAEYGSSTSELETLDPFMRYLNSRFQGISNMRKRRRLEDLFLNELKKTEDEESDQNY